MKLNIPDRSSAQADPYIFEDNERYYLYVSAMAGDGIGGVGAYSADTLNGRWQYEGTVCTVDSKRDYWAPCIIKLDGVYYLYFSCEEENDCRCLYVAHSDRPLGPFTGEKKLYDAFSIDPHVVKTDEGLFLFLAMDSTDGDRIGTMIWVDRLLDPYTPAGTPKQVLWASFNQEMFQANRFGDGRDWYTLEGPFWFREGAWQYLMYSAGCFGNDTYHVGYAVAPADEQDLTKVTFVKHDNQGAFDPVLIKNENEEGTGHHSVIRVDGQYYAVYHGRDYDPTDHRIDRRTARFCPLTVKDGVITAHRT